MYEPVFADTVLIDLRFKTNVLRKASQLGARTMSDLTDQVTHLICDAPGSAKYNVSSTNLLLELCNKSSREHSIASLIGYQS